MSLKVLAFLIIPILCSACKDSEFMTENSMEEGTQSKDNDSFFPGGFGYNYINLYKLANLPSLKNKRESKNTIRFRLGVFPSNSNPIFYSYYKENSKTYIDVKRLALKLGTDYIESDELDLTAKVLLNEEQVFQIENKILEGDVRSVLAKFTDEQRLWLEVFEGFDGTRFILEVCTDKDYTIEQIWEPHNLPYLLFYIERDSDKYIFPDVDASGFIDLCENVFQATRIRY